MSQLVFVYDTPKATVESATLEGIVAAGGVVLAGFSPGPAQPRTTTGEAVTVRDGIGRLDLVRAADGRTSRLLEWTEIDSSKATIVWWLQTDTASTSKEQIVALANSLVDLD